MLIRFLAFFLIVLSVFFICTDKSAAQDELALHQNLRTLSEDLPEQDKMHFFTMYNNDNLIETVKTVASDVGKAVAACGENNPDMAGPLAARFESWQEAIKPVMEEARGHLENMILAQDYLPAESIRGVLDLAHQTRTETQSKISKIPVTSVEACTFLLHKMDETQSSMIGLLQATLNAVPQAAETNAAEEPEEEPSGEATEP